MDAMGTENQQSNPLLPLPDDVEALKALIRRQSAEITQQSETIAKLEHHVAVLTKLVFGPKSEKRSIDGKDQLQGHLFLATLIAQAEQIAQQKSVATTVELVRDATPAKRNARRKSFPSHLPRVQTILDLKPEQRICCGSEMKPMGEEITRELERVEIAIVHEFVRKKYCCRVCQEHVKIASGPDRVIDKGILGTGFLAHVIAERFGHHMPYHRLEKKYASEGLDLSRTILCRSSLQCAELLQPIWDAMVNEVRASPVIHTDDTPVVLQESSDGERATGRLWIYRDLDGRLVYDFSESRSRDGPLKILGDYAGYIQADAFPGYDIFFAPRGRATELACWAHARRYFVRARDSDATLADAAIERIGQLYAVERVAKLQELSADGRCELRRSMAKPVLTALKPWLELTRMQVLDKSPMAKAIDYTLSNWNALVRYVEDGRLNLDNLPAERALRAVAVGRKNWMMIGNERGGNAAAVLYTLVQTCKEIGIVPQTYLRDVLLRIGRESDVTKLTPHGWKKHFAAEVESELARAARLLKDALAA
jgi:transposase